MSIFTVEDLVHVLRPIQEQLAVGIKLEVHETEIGIIKIWASQMTLWQILRTWFSRKLRVPIKFSYYYEDK